MAGTLYLVATPIGNLEDMTYRAVRILKEVDIIAAEDTRNSIKILNHFDIHTPMTSYHEFNKIDKAVELIAELKEGKSVAVITDAGMPGISDPGEELTAMCYEEGITVNVVPGACAAVTAVTGSGLPCRRFAFEAFLPKDKKEKARVFDELSRETRTIIIYESPHHLKETLKELATVFGENRRMNVTRELTKLHEDKVLTTIGEAVAYYRENDPRGEYVLVIEGKSKHEVEAEKQSRWEDMSLEDHLAMYEAEGLDRKAAMKKVAADRGVSKRDIYNQLL